MKRIAVIAISPGEARIAVELASRLGSAGVYVHEATVLPPELRKARVQRFSRVRELTAELFTKCRGLIYVLPCGVAVRSVAPCLAHKKTDPAVVVVDAMARHAVALLSGHEGGANDLALEVANLLGAEPVISTTTEAAKSIIVGVGCRRGVKAPVIRRAVLTALAEAGVELSDVRMLATADIKSREPGLLAAASGLGLPLRIIAGEELRQCRREFAHSEFVKSKVNLPAVAEPAALLAGRRTQLILPRRASDGVTVAVARESSPWSASGRAAKPTAPAARKMPSARPRS